MKKFLILILFLFILLGCTKKNYQVVSFKYTNSSYLDTQINNKELLLTSYNEYQTFINKYNLDNEIDESDFTNNYYLVIFDNNMCNTEKEINNIKYYNDTLEIIYNKHNICGLCSPHTDIYFYKIDKIEIKSIKTKIKYIKDKECEPDIAYKPILYIYPNKNMNISIKLEHHNNIITSYPKYDNGWNIYVEKNGKIYYNNREFYALYWDEYINNTVDFSEGFYVDSNNASKFLEEKLDIIGLNNREANEFIMYWLPILEKNEKNLIYFELTDERESYNHLYIEPKPDSVLRLFMRVKKVNNKVNIKGQKLDTFNRYGFVAVEWGGTNLEQE